MFSFLDKGDDLLFELLKGPFEFMIKGLAEIRDTYPIEIVTAMLQL